MFSTIFRIARRAMYSAAQFAKSDLGRALIIAICKVIENWAKS